MIERVVLATDFSAGARRALKRVQHLPLTQGAEVLLVHVLPRHRLVEQATARIEHEADTLRTALRRLERSDVSVRSILPSGNPPVEIANVARDGAANLIVVGRHGAGNIRTFLLGCTAERVIHASDVPVLVVGRRPTGPYVAPLAALADDDTADDETSRFVLDTVLRVLPSSARRLDVATAIFVPMEGWLWVGWISSDEILRLRATARKRARQGLERALAPYRARGLRVRVSMQDGDPRVVILGLARRLGADILVLGTHAKTGTVRFRLGSVAADVMRHAACDVLVARPPGLFIEGA